jgi:hypothetical protein
MVWGSNKYGDKKIYNITRFHERLKLYPQGICVISGILIGYFLLALHYKKVEHDHWVYTYGDYIPRYERLGVFTIRSFGI